MNAAHDQRAHSSSWSSYIDEFHRQRPGITERVLERARGDDINPYQWTAAAIRTSGGVLDLACGSGPLGAYLPSGWVGLDRSPNELDAAHRRGAEPLVRGDAIALPFADQAFDAVVCCMALMLTRPLLDTLTETRRVLRPAGQLITLLPSTRPTTFTDRLRWGQLLLALRRPRLNYPNDHDLSEPAAIFQHAGLTVISDERRRFAYHANTTQTATELVESLYLPDVPDQRRRAAHRVAKRWADTTIGIPLRRLVAVRADIASRTHGDGDS